MLNLQDVINKFLRRSVIDEKAVKLLIKELQRALLSADVDVPLVLSLSKRIEQKVKKDKPKDMTLREYVIKVVYDELVAISGEGYRPSFVKHKIMLVGLYGSGKTTTAAKLAYFYKNNNLSTYLISVDNDRPAAKEQLRQLAEQINVPFCSRDGSVKQILTACLNLNKDVILVDTAGRNAFDKKLAEEIREIYDIFQPDEVFLVLSADTGHLAKIQAEQFSSILPLSGVIITKLDGSGKGGGALTAVASLNLKIAFVGVGEKVHQLEVYDPKSFISSLLGIKKGDIKSILEKFKQLQPDLKVNAFTLETFYEQLKSAREVSISSMLGNLGISLPNQVVNEGEEEIKKFRSIIESMTPEERRDPELVRKSSSRVERIARGSGRTSQEVRQLLNKFFKMKSMFDKINKDRSLKRKLQSMLKGKLF